MIRVIDQLPNENDTVRVNYTDDSKFVSVPRTTVGKVTERGTNAVRVRPYSTRTPRIELRVERDRLVVYHGETGQRFGPVEKLYTAEQSDLAHPSSGLRRARSRRGAPTGPQEPSDPSRV